MNGPFATFLLGPAMKKNEVQVTTTTVKHKENELPAQLIPIKSKVPDGRACG